jgi:hypothetical protein
MSRDPKNVRVIINNSANTSAVILSRRGARSRIAVAAGGTLDTLITESDFRIYKDQLLAAVRAKVADEYVSPGGFIDIGNGRAYLTGNHTLSSTFSLGESDRFLEHVELVGDLTRAGTGNIYCRELVLGGDLILGGTGEAFVDELVVGGDLAVNTGTVTTNVFKDVVVEGNMAVAAAAGLDASNIRVGGNASWVALSAVCTLRNPVVEGTTTLAATAGVVTMLNAVLVGAVTNPGARITHVAVTYPA